MTQTAHASNSRPNWQRRSRKRSLVAPDRKHVPLSRDCHRRSGADPTPTSALPAGPRRNGRSTHVPRSSCTSAPRSHAILAIPCTSSIVTRAGTPANPCRRGLGAWYARGDPRGRERRGPAKRAPRPGGGHRPSRPLDFGITTGAWTGAHRRQPLSATSTLGTGTTARSPGAITRAFGRARALPYFPVSTTGDRLVPLVEIPTCPSWTGTCSSSCGSIPMPRQTA